MTLKRDPDTGKLPSFTSSCLFCEHATMNKDCRKRTEPGLLQPVIAFWHRGFWKTLTNAERKVAHGCPGFELSKWCVNNNKSHFGEPVVRKTPKSWG